MKKNKEKNKNLFSHESKPAHKTLNFGTFIESFLTLVYLFYAPP